MKSHEEIFNSLFKLQKTHTQSEVSDRALNLKSQIERCEGLQFGTNCVIFTQKIFPQIKSESSNNSRSIRSRAV